MLSHSRGLVSLLVTALLVFAGPHRPCPASSTGPATLADQFPGLRQELKCVFSIYSSAV